jgi:hypothetical protein
VPTKKRITSKTFKFSLSHIFVWVFACLIGIVLLATIFNPNVLDFSALRKVTESLASTTITGTFYSGHFDDFKSNKSTFQKTVIDSSGNVYGVNSIGDTSEIENGTQVRFSANTKNLGTRSFSISSPGKLEILKKPSSNRTVSLAGNKTIKILVIPFSFSDTPITSSELSAIDISMDTATKHIKKASFGDAEYSYKKITPVKIDSPITSATNESGENCPEVWKWVIEANTKAKENTSVSGYDVLMYVHPFVKLCAYGGLASVSKEVVINGNEAVQVYIHELGHTLRMGHANSLNCKSVAIDSYSRCTWKEYGDKFDPMGDGSTTDFNTSFKQTAGFIPITESIITKSGTYTVPALEVSNGTPQGLRIAKNDTGDKYVISYRSRLENDNQDPIPKNGGTFVYIEEIKSGDPNAGSKFFIPTSLLDMTPGDNSFDNAYLQDNTSFCDPVNKINIKQVSHTSKSAVLSVELGSGCGDATVAGVLDQVSLYGTIIGWAGQRGDPSKSVDVRLKIDDTLITTVRADGVDTRSHDAGFPGGHGFNYGLPEKYRDGKEHTLIAEVLVTQTVGSKSNEAWVNIPGSPQKFIYGSASSSSTCPVCDAKEQLTKAVEYCNGHASNKSDCTLMENALNDSYGPCSVCQARKNQCTNGSQSGICVVAASFQKAVDWCYNITASDTSRASKAGVNGQFCNTLAKNTQSSHEECNVCGLTSTPKTPKPVSTPRPREVSGNVYDANGKGVSGVKMQIEVTQSDGTEKTYYPLTDSSGHFRQVSVLEYQARYNVKIASNPSGQQGPALTINKIGFAHNYCDGAKDVQPGNTAYMCQQSQFWDCAGPDGGAPRCNFQYGNILPYGSMERINNGVVRGWVVDPNKQDVSLDVQIYLDNDREKNGVYITTLKANEKSSDLPYQGNHRFSWTIPQIYYDSKPHTVYAYGVDTENSKKDRTFLGALIGLKQGFNYVDKIPTGYLDGIYGTVVSGWTRDDDTPDTPLRVDIYIDGQAGSGAAGFSTQANLNRSDVGKHGYNFTIPAQYQDGKSHTIYAYAINSNPGGKNKLLSGSPKTYQSASAPADKAPIGFFDGFSGDIAAGWTRDDDTPNYGLQVHLYVGGPAGSGVGHITIANLNRSDVGAHGFNFTMPPQYKDGKSYPVYAYGINSKSGGANTLLTGSPKTYKYTAPPPAVDRAPTGNFDGIANNTAFGWSWDQDTSNTPTQVHIYIDGPAGSGKGFVTNANSYHSPSVGNRAFVFPIPKEYRDRKSHSIYAYGINTKSGGANTLLPGSPKQYTYVPTAPTCGGLVGPTSIKLGQSATYSGNFSSPDGDLGAVIGYGANGKYIGPWPPRYPGGTNYSGSWTFTPTAAGQYNIACRVWNDGIQECAGGNGWGIPACAGPGSQMTLTVNP